MVYIMKSKWGEKKIYYHDPSQHSLLIWIWQKPTQQLRPYRGLVRWETLICQNSHEIGWQAGQGMLELEQATEHRRKTWGFGQDSWFHFNFHVIPISVSFPFHTLASPSERCARRYFFVSFLLHFLFSLNLHASFTSCKCYCVHSWGALWKLSSTDGIH